MKMMKTGLVGDYGRGGNSWKIHNSDFGKTTENVCTPLQSLHVMRSRQECWGTTSTTVIYRRKSRHPR